MGKVLSKFTNGWPGTVSRVKDDVIVSLKNVGQTAINFGDPVFLYNGVTPGGVRGFISGTTTENDFVGFAVRVPDKTPDSYGSGQEGADSTGAWAPGDTADILVRGSTAVPIQTANAKIGDKVYIRLSDQRLVTAAGESGTTAELPNVTVRGSRDSRGFCEVTVTKRNVI